MTSKRLVENDTCRLASLRGIPTTGIQAALTAGVLSFAEHRTFHAWFIRDERAGCVRRLDGKPWQTTKGQAKALDTQGTSGLRTIGWPVGILLAESLQTVIVCEGGADLLAAYAVRALLGGNYAIVCLLGSALTIHESALAHFAGKRVRFIAHTDEPGRSFAERNAALLAPITEQVSIADLRRLRTADDTEATDLCDALAFRNPWSVPDEIAGLFDFEKPSPLVRVVAAERNLFRASENGSAFVTEEDRRRTEGRQTKTDDGERGEREEELRALREKAQSLACTARHQSYRLLFQLAREVRAYELSNSGEDRAARNAAFDAWHSASQPNLDPAETRAYYLARFRRAIRTARVPAGGDETLRLAIERAKTAPLPDIPDAPDAPEEWRLVAAVCRELQRAAGDAFFFITKRAAMELIGGKHPMEGQRVLDALDDLHVIRCVQPGDSRPRKDGEQKKASRYRYLLTLS